jgi:hypothetical protein
LINALMVLSGCHGMAGHWEGEMTCEGSEDAVDIEFDLLGVTAKNFAGDGTIGDDLALCKGDFSVAVKSKEPTGQQSVNVEMEGCKITCVDGTQYMDCGEAARAKWDGQDLLTFQIDTCDFELERDSSLLD